VAPLPIAAGRTKGCWWDHRVDLNASFRENMKLEGVDAKNHGCGIFTLDETNLQVTLAGVYGSDLRDKDWVAYPSTPSPGAIRKLLEAHRRKAAAGR
jgi:hypothetical protein